MNSTVKKASVPITLGLVLVILAGCVSTAKAPAAGNPGNLNGTWKGSGLDDRGVAWEFTFVFSQNGANLTGTGEWTGSDGATATTKMVGTINAASRSFAFQDVAIGDSSGDIAQAEYTGTLSADYQKLSGEWTIPGGGSPGKFTAAKSN
jgi:hypothetical protein